MVENGADAAVSEAVERVAAELYALEAHRPIRRPGATYRVQVNRGFRLDDVVGLLDYLHDLGITDVYFSPYFEARPGSTHGYDVFDHSRINPEIGDDSAHRRLLRRLADRNMGRVLDIVPNHMGVAGANRYWLDVLELGPQSASANFFDIEWNPVKEELHNRVLLPILGDLYSKVLEGGSIELGRDEGTLFVQVYDHRFPLEPRSYPTVLLAREPALLDAFPADDENLQEYLSIVDSARLLPARTETDPDKVLQVRRERDVMKRRLGRLCRENPKIAALVDDSIRSFRGVEGNPASFDPLHRLLEQQVFRLAYWRVASEEINYRRFFDINDLAGVRVEDPAVFDAVHDQVIRWVQDGGVSGLRIDHPDGLADPKGYFARLQESILLLACRSRFDAEPRDVAWGPVADRIRALSQRDLYADPHSAAARRFPVVAEKILTGDEPLPRDWPIDGTVGYEFLNMLNGVFVAPEAEPVISATYREFTGDETPFEDVVLECKRLIIGSSMASELNMLARLLEKAAARDRRGRDITHDEMRRALLEILAWFPVYRTYLRIQDPIADRDRAYIEHAIRAAQEADPGLDGTVFEFLRLVLLEEVLEGATEELRAEFLAFVIRFQQTSGPVQAKGLEDTAFYRQVKLASLTEVGGEPTHFGREPGAFHELNLQRLRDWPGGLSTTATHDTKRGEDARIRINVLSEIPGEWDAAVRRWSALNARHKVQAKGIPAPDPREEYLYYQTLVGSWPFEEESGPASPAYVARIQEYMNKAVREAKVNTNWTDPDPGYSEAVAHFVGETLAGPDSAPFVDDLRAFAGRVGRVGVVHSLSQVLLKLASPGSPDIYQGNALWDFNLVDPDNRRPVDYARRADLLRDALGRLEAGTPRATLVGELLESAPDGAIKQYLTASVLRFRKDNLELFAEGDYLPLAFHGPRGRHLIGFARRDTHRTVLIVAARLVAGMMGDDGSARPVGEAAWGSTTLELPEGLEPTRWRNILTDDFVDASGRHLAIADVFRILPVAMLEGA